MGACPERSIGFKNYNVDITGSMIKSIDVPDDDKDKLRFIQLVCENDAYPTLGMAAMGKYGLNNLVRVIVVDNRSANRLFAERYRSTTGYYYKGEYHV